MEEIACWKTLGTGEMFQQVWSKGRMQLLTNMFAGKGMVKHPIPAGSVRLEKFCFST